MYNINVYASIQNIVEKYYMLVRHNIHKSINYEIMAIREVLEGGESFLYKLWSMVGVRLEQETSKIETSIASNKPFVRVLPNLDEGVEGYVVQDQVAK